MKSVTKTRLKRFSVHKRDLYVDIIDNVDKIDNWSFWQKVTYVKKSYILVGTFNFSAKIKTTLSKQ